MIQRVVFYIATCNVLWCAIQLYRMREEDKVELLEIGGIIKTGKRRDQTYFACTFSRTPLDPSQLRISLHK